MSRALQAVREAAVDGRLQNVITRQTQLESLHKVLLENVASIEAAIKKDSGHSEAESAVELVLTLRGLLDYYATLDEKLALHREYAIARGEDGPERQDGIGIVYLVPTNYTLFYSVVITICASIASGNCIVIEVRDLQDNRHTRLTVLP